MKKSIKWIFRILVVLVLFSLWYNWKYSMGVSQPYTINDSTLSKKLLVITQQSEYKDDVTRQITDALNGTDIFVSVVDITAMHRVYTKEFDAFLIIHTYEMWKPPSQVSQFLKETTNRDNIYIIATSGGGDLLSEGVDGISSASVLESAPKDVSKALRWIENHFSLEG